MLLRLQSGVELMKIPPDLGSALGVVALARGLPWVCRARLRSAVRRRGVIAGGCYLLGSHAIASAASPPRHRMERSSRERLPAGRRTPDAVTPAAR